MNKDVWGCPELCWVCALQADLVLLAADAMRLAQKRRMKPWTALFAAVHNRNVRPWCHTGLHVARRKRVSIPYVRVHVCVAWVHVRVRAFASLCAHGSVYLSLAHVLRAQ